MARDGVRLTSVARMGEPLERGDQHSQRLDDNMARHPADAADSADVGLWDRPGRDGVIGDVDSDPDRTDLRSTIGQYVSLVTFPTDAGALAGAAERHNAPDEVSARLRRLDPRTRLENTSQLWDALDLASGRRF